MVLMYKFRPDPVDPWSCLMRGLLFPLPPKKQDPISITAHLISSLEGWTPTFRLEPHFRRKREREGSGRRLAANHSGPITAAGAREAIKIVALLRPAHDLFYLPETRVPSFDRDDILVWRLWVTEEVFTYVVPQR